jgi:hypothetical protein
MRGPLCRAARGRVGLCLSSLASMRNGGYCNGNCQRQYQLLWSDDRAYEWSVADGSGGNDEYLRSHNPSAVKEQWRAEHPRENVKWFCTGKLGKRDKDKWTQHWKNKVMADPS